MGITEIASISLCVNLRKNKHNTLKNEEIKQMFLHVKRNLLKGLITIIKQMQKIELFILVYK